MEPTLAVIGLNYRTSPVAVRERFWIGEPGRYEAFDHLLRSEGVDGAIVLATSNRTEFILWAKDVPAAANSVLRLLPHNYQLKLRDWSLTFPYAAVEPAMGVLGDLSGSEVLLGAGRMSESAAKCLRNAGA